MTSSPASISAPRRSARGFTLVEVLVSIAIGLIILTALVVMFANNSRNNGAREAAGRQLEGARYAVDTLASDLRHAGFYGEFNIVDLGPAFEDPDPCATNPANLGWNTAVLPPHMPVPVHGIPAGTVVACLADRLAGTAAITIRRVGTGDDQTVATMAAGNLYLQVSRCNDDAAQIVASTNGVDFTLRDIACGGAIDSVRRYVTRTYYIASCDDCVARDGIPTLKRVEFVNGELRTTAVAEGIENLQLEYGLDTDAGMDGRPNEWLAAEAVNGVPASRAWKNVVATRIHMLSRNTEPTPGYSDPRTYVMGPVTVTPAALSPAAAAYKRTLLTQTVRMFNVGDHYDK